MSSAAVIGTAPLRRRDNAIAVIPALSATAFCFNRLRAIITRTSSATAPSISCIVAILITPRYAPE
jgi:hypothetical protein